MASLQFGKFIVSDTLPGRRREHAGSARDERRDPGQRERRREARQRRREVPRPRGVVDDVRLPPAGPRGGEVLVQREAGDNPERSFS